MDRRRRNPVTLEDVARAAGVSRATASRALLAPGPAATPARARVREAAARMGFRPDPAARALAGGAGTRIVVAVLGVEPAVDPLDCAHTSAVASAAAATADRHGLGTALRWAPVPAAPRLLAELAEDRSVHGVVLVNTTWAALEAVPAALRGRVVSIGVGTGAVPSVDVDSLAGATAVVRHLVDSGRRRIAMVEPPAWLPCAQRLCRAYADVLGAAGLPLRAVPGGFGSADGRAGATAIMRRWPDTDAVFAASDATAFGAIGALRELGVDVPGDVAVAGFDDEPAAALADPALTTASHPVRRIAAAAAEVALAGPGAAGSPVLFPSELVRRISA
jgi:DNA-binding LacI/PurR family transcriptional regulator